MAANAEHNMQKKEKRNKHGVIKLTANKKTLHVKSMWTSEEETYKI